MQPPRARSADCAPRIAVHAHTGLPTKTAHRDLARYAADNGLARQTLLLRASLAVGEVEGQHATLVRPAELFTGDRRQLIVLVLGLDAL